MHIPERFRQVIQAALLPLSLALLLTLFGLAQRSLGVPGIDELMEWIESFFKTYGTLTLFVAVFIEGVFMVNFYFPGSFVLLVAILLSDRSFEALAEITALAWAALLLSSLLNYCIGRYGLYRFFRLLGGDLMIHNMERWLAKWGRYALLFAGANPNMLAIAMVSYGIARMPPLRALLYAGLIMALWGPVIVGIFASILPDPHDIKGGYWIGVSLLWGWAMILVIREALRPRNDTPAHTSEAS